MMSFADDRRLLMLEPNVFRDVKFAAQRYIDVSDGSISGTTLSSLQANFTAQQIDAGCVALVENVPFEVVEVLTANTLTLSKLRVSTDDDPIPPFSGINLGVEIYSFRPQIAVVHQQLLRAIALEPDPVTGGVDESQIVNAEDVALVEALGALHLAYVGASALVGEHGILWQKSEVYRERYRAARERLNVQLDLDGDGMADASRFVNVLQFVRV